MKRTHQRVIGLLVLAALAVRPAAAETASASAAGGAPSETCASVAPSQFAISSSGGALGQFAAHPITLEAVSYQPRGHYHPAGHGPQLGSQTQIHAGFFDPNGNAGEGFVMGVRGGPLVDPRIQVGMGVDWEHRGDQQSVVLGSSSGPGGTVITTQRQLSSSSENTFPILAFLQVAGDGRMRVIPYGGIAGGYEIVTLSATDFASSASFNATYGGWGWQAWLGAKIPLSGRSGLMAEVYTNQAEASRDVYDPFLAATFRETVRLDGFGMRFGLSWGI